MYIFYRHTRGAYTLPSLTPRPILYLITCTVLLTVPYCPLYRILSFSRAPYLHLYRTFTFAVPTFIRYFHSYRVPSLIPYFRLHRIPSHPFRLSFFFEDRHRASERNVYRSGPRGKVWTFSPEAKRILFRQLQAYAEAIEVMGPRTVLWHQEHSSDHQAGNV